MKKLFFENLIDDKFLYQRKLHKKFLVQLIQDKFGEAKQQNTSVCVLLIEIAKSIIKSIIKL